jgi:ABC-2 type transport system permease protein
MNPTIASITARGLLGRRRFLALLLLPAALVGLAILADATSVPATDWAPTVLEGLGTNVVVPLVALIIGTGVVGAELDDGTLAHILAKPVPRAQIIATKLMVAVAATVTAVVPAMFVAGTLAGGARLGVGLAVGSALASTAYCALFVAMSLLTSRPVLTGLAYVLLWEGMLGSVISGTQVLSVGQYGLAVADAVGDTALLTGKVSVPVSLILAAILTAGATFLAIDRLRSYRLAGETG